MAKENSNNGHKTVVTANSGKADNRLVEVIVKDGKLVADDSSPEVAVKR